MKWFIYSLTFLIGLSLYADFNVSIEEVSIGENAKDFKISDFDNDGRKDVVYLKEDGDINVGLQQQKDAENFTKNKPLVEGENVNKFEITQFNNDNRNDIVFLNESGDIKVALQGLDYTPVFEGNDSSKWNFSTQSGSSAFVYDETNGYYSFSGSGTSTMELEEIYSFDISNLEHPVLQYEELAAHTPSRKIEVKVIGTDDWITIHTDSSNQNSFRKQEFSLLPFKKSVSNITIKFSSYSGYSDSYWTIKNISVKEKFQKPTLINGDTYELNSESFTTDTNWSTVDDTVLKFSGLASNQIAEFNYKYDLRSFNHPVLSFDHSSIGTASTVSFQLSPDGDNQWKEIFAFNNIYQSNWLNKEISLIDFKSSGNTFAHLRIIITSGHAGSIYQVRNFKIIEKFIFTTQTESTSLHPDSEKWKLSDGFTVDEIEERIKFSAIIGTDQTALYKYNFDISSYEHPMLSFEDYAVGTAQQVSIQVSPNGEDQWTNAYTLNNIHQTFWKRKKISFKEFKDNGNSFAHFRINISNGHSGSLYILKNIKIIEKTSFQTQTDSNTLKPLQDNWELDTGFTVDETEKRVKFSTIIGYDLVALYKYNFDISSYENPMVSFEDYSFGTAQKVAIQVSPNGENQWTDVYNLNNIHQNFWKDKKVSLKEFKDNSNTLLHLRININNGHSGSSYMLRNIEVVDERTNLDSFTHYDGNGDSYSSSDSKLKISGAQTWCAEIRLPPEQSYNYAGILSNNIDGNNGIALYYQPGLEKVRFETRGSGGDLIELEPTADGNTWNKVVAFYDGTSIHMHLFNGTEWSSVSKAVSLNTSQYNFNIGKVIFGSDYFFNGDIKNIQIFSGYPSNPEEWTPENTSSLNDTTLVFNSPNGSGTDNSQDIIFTQGGNPEIKTVPDYVARYTFDNTSNLGENSADTNKEDITLYGGSILNEGVQGSALTFNGTSDYGTISNILNTKDASISIWIKVNNFTNEARIIGRRHYPSESRNFSLRLNTNQNARFSSDKGQVDSSTNINDSNWHHLVLTHNKTTGTTNLYVNGQFDGALNNSTGIDLQTYNSNIPVVIGKYLSTDNTDGNHFDGSLDEIRIYERELSEAEALEIYNAEK